MAFNAKDRVGKYNVSPVADRIWADIIFDSKFEMAVAQALVMALPASTKIHLQTKFTLLPTQTGVDSRGKEKVLYKTRGYKADFVIRDSSDPEQYMVLDAKGMVLDTFSLKAALFYWVWKREITLVKSSVKNLSLLDWARYGLKPNIEVFTNPKLRREMLPKLTTEEIRSRFVLSINQQ